MYVKQLYTSCLSEAAYYIESNGEAAIIDPLRDTDSYLQLARDRSSNIKFIFETHFHADFVSGHIDLADITGAPIIFGPGTETNFPVHLAEDGEVFKIGDITLEVMHTPGHTLESTCYLLKDETGKPYCLFSGDTLFVGDVGRPDLSSGEMSKEELAEIMYNTIQTKIMPLDDDIILYPAHGPGSSCGKNLGPETYSTIGEQKKSNYALKAQSMEEFVKKVTEGLTDPPAYFSMNAKINKEGYESLEKVILKGLVPLTTEQFKEKVEGDVFILDTRKAEEFINGFIPGSVSIGLEGRFAEWAGSLLPFNESIILVTDKGKEEETIIRLARVGFDKVEGYLAGGFETWKNAGEPIDLIIEIETDELAMDMPFDPKMMVVDVRREAEFANGHVEGALNLPLSDMKDIALIANLEDDQNLYIHCAGGYRSAIAASLLKKQGIHNLRNIAGGWDKIKVQEGIKTAKEASVLN